MQPRFLLIILALLILESSKLSASETLRQVLAANAIDSQGVDKSLLDKKITSYALLNDPEVFCIAYYSDDGSTRLADMLSVDLFEKFRRTWVREKFGEETLVADNEHFPPGPVIRVERSGGFLYLHTHVNPSAGYTIILSRPEGLRFHDAVYGWPLGIFPDGTLIYQNSAIHFAPTHYVEVSVYDPHRKRHWLIYPSKPYQDVRREQIEKVRGAYEKRGEAWFRAHNHHGNPELFDNYLTREFAVNDQTRSLAFRVNYDNRDYWGDEDKLKLEGSRALQDCVAGVELAKTLPECVFASLRADLTRIRNLNSQQEFLRIFQDDPELYPLIERAVETMARQEGQDWRRHYDSLDPRWQKPELWQRLVNVLATPPEITEVICIFRDVGQPEKMAYREMLWSDFRHKFGDRGLEEYLSAERLGKIFAE